jgi:PTS system cellobiose-specific IIC component
MFYDYLLKHGVKLTLPEQVPSMVAESMNPIFAAMILFAVVLGIKWGVSLTPYGDIFNMLYQLLTAPTMATFGTSIATPLVWCMLRALFWFFGIHPSPLNAMYYPLSSIATAANVDAFMAGEPLPYLAFSVMTTFAMIGGTGSTLGLNIMMLRAKSERYKALSKVAIVPSCFNINEPLVFGVPMMYNPLMLIPSLLAPVAGGVVCFVLTKLNLIALNPTVSVAWVVPYPIAAFLRGGIFFTLGVLITIVLQGLIYYPFFQILDKQALEEEKAALEEIEN